MNLKHLGTEYGGWWVDVDRIPPDGLVIDAGIGTDLSFASSLKEIFPSLRFFGVDHTEDSEKYVKDRAIPGYEYARAALVGAGHKGDVVAFKNPKLGSESIYPDHRFVDPKTSYPVTTLELAGLVRTLNPCIVKLDIEGAEYDCFRDCFGVPQVCIEWHHRMMSRFTLADTDAALAEFAARGYVLAHRTPTDEVLLVLEKR